MPILVIYRVEMAESRESSRSNVVTGAAYSDTCCESA